MLTNQNNLGDAGTNKNALQTKTNRHRKIQVYRGKSERERAANVLWDIWFREVILVYI